MIAIGYLQPSECPSEDFLKILANKKSLVPVRVMLNINKNQLG